MEIEFYRDLMISSLWQTRRVEMIRKLKGKKLPRGAYVLTLAQGEQNQLEFFEASLLRQKIFDRQKLFVVGIADGYESALEMTEELTRKVYENTGSADLRKFITERQMEYEKTGR